MPSACLAQPCSVSMLDELVRPISSLGFTPWRSISLSTPQVVNGCAEIATMSALARCMSRTWVEKVVSLSSHSAVPSTWIAVGVGLRLHDAVGRVRMREILLDAAEDRLQVGMLRLDPGEQRLVHLEFARHVAERPFGDFRKPALGRHVGDDRELQPAVGGIADLLLQDAEQRLGDVGAGRPDRDERVARGDAAHDRDAFLGVAAVVEEFDRRTWPCCRRPA